MDDTDSLVPGVKSWLVENKWHAVIGLFGLFLLLVGLGEWWKGQNNAESEVVVIESEKTSNKQLIVDVSGAVVKPGVYDVPVNSRLGEVIEVAGGLSDKANIEWISKTLNLAQTVKDGDKVYIPFVDESKLDNSIDAVSATREGGQTEKKSELVDINTAPESKLVELWGIGESRAKTIIEHRPYQNIEQIIDKAGVPLSVFEKIKEQITVY